MSAEKIKDNIYSIGVKDPKLRIFDIVMETKKGTTYNSFVIDDEKIAVVDICKNGFYDQFKKNLTEVIGDRKVDYVIVQHTELDHSGSIAKLLEDYPDATVISTKIANTFVENILNKKFNGIEVPDELNLGKTNLKFFKAPNLHWPDTMFTYAQESKVLFTCDFTGAHYCPEGSILNNDNDNFTADTKYYFDCIMGPFKPYVLKGLETVKDLDIDVIAPSHGPLHIGKESIKRVFDLYKEWSLEFPVQKDKIEIFYISAYKNTENVAKYISDKLKAQGYSANYHDLNQIDLSEAAHLVSISKGFMVGSPTITADAVKPAWDLLSVVNPIVNRGKAAMAFGSFGWSGEGVGMLTDRMKSLKLKVVEPGFKFKFVPSEEDYKNLDKLIENFIALL